MTSFTEKNIKKLYKWKYRCRIALKLFSSSISFQTIVCPHNTSWKLLPFQNVHVLKNVFQQITRTVLLISSWCSFSSRNSWTCCFNFFNTRNHGCNSFWCSIIWPPFLSFCSLSANYFAKFQYWIVVQRLYELLYNANLTLDMIMEMDCFVFIVYIQSEKNAMCFHWEFYVYILLKTSEFGILWINWFVWYQFRWQF